MLLYLATGVLARGIPAGLATNASQITCHGLDTHSGLCPRRPRINGISVELFETFQLMAQYTAASYCSSNSDTTAALVTCPPKVCPLVEEAGAKTVTEFKDTTEADVTGFVAVDEKNGLIVVSFRGSRSHANWQQNHKIKRVPTDLCPKCRAHQGFWNAWLEIRDRIRDQVLHLRAGYPDFRLAIMGHSFGGAIATLAAGDLRRTNEDLLRVTEVYSFGSPRVGGEHLVEFLSKQSTLSYRITNNRDPVPRLPPWITGFRHTSPEYKIEHHSANPSPEDFQIFDGYLNPGGNAGSGNFLWGWPKHRSYFSKKISACSKEEGDDSRR